MSEPAAPQFIARIVDRLRTVGGVVGVVLGGSRARGTNAPDSDWDVGVYYEDDESLDLAALDDAARDLNDERKPGLVAAPGMWGPWVNGGAWLVVEGAHVDLILRDIRRVGNAVGDCLRGKVTGHYQTGHPHAYLNAMYAGELAIAEILSDPSGRIAALKAKTVPYPEALRKAILRQFGFEAGFSLMFAKAAAEKDDDYYVAAHIVRSLSCANQALFAVNREYCVNEKKAVRMVDGFARKPADYRRRVDSIVSLAGNDNAKACAELEALVEEIGRLQ